MATISLFTTGSGIYDHKHIYEDLTSQIDGYSFIFNTSFPYLSGTLTAIYNGVVYTKDNDFAETGPQQFTFFSGDPFPPELGSPLFVEYRMVIP